MGSAIERLQKRLYGKTSSTTNTAKNQDSAVKRVQDMVYHGKPFTVNEERSYVAQAAAKRKDVLLDTVVETVKKGKGPTVTSKLDTKTGRTSGGISSGRRAKTVESGSGGRSGRETFSPVKLGVGAMTKGADQFVSGLTSTAAWLEDNTLGRLFPGSTEDTPIDALNRYFQGVKAANEKTFAPNVAAGGKVAKAVDKYGTAAAAAIPQAALALMTAGGSAGASAASAGMKAAQASPGILAALKSSAGAMAKNPQFWTSFLQTAGNSYEQARADGAGETEASLYALANSLAGAGVEIGGGIQTLPGKLAEGGGALRSWVRSMIEEGREEVVQGAIERGLQNLTYDRGRPLASLTDPEAVLNPKSAAEEFTGGAVVGGLLGGGQALVSHGLGKLAQNGPGAPAQSAGAFGQDGGTVDATGAQDGAQGVPGQHKTAPEVGAAVNKGETVQVIENLRNHIPSLQGMTPVSTVSANSIPFVEGKTMAEKARKLFDAIKGVVTRPGFGDVDINGRSVKDDLSHGVGAAKAAVIPAIPEIIRQGKQIDFQQNWKGRAYDGYVFAAPVTMDGHIAYVAAVVKRTSKNRFYLHEVIDADGNVIKIDAGESANQTSLAANGDAGTHSPASMDLTPITYADTGRDPAANVTGTAPVEGTRPLNSDSTIPQDAEDVNSVDPLLSPENDGLGAANAGFLGDSERGFSKNITTDEGMAPELRESFQDDPEMYFRLGNKETLAKAQAIFDGGLESARSTLERALGAAQSGMKLPPEMVPLSRMVANELTRQGDWYSARKILSDVSVELTEAGQLGQAAVILRDTGHAGKVMTVEKLVERAKQALSADGLDIQVEDSLFQAYADAQTDAEQDAAIGAIQQRIAEQVPSTLLEKWTALRYVNMLGNFKTQVRNVTGNVGMALVSRAKNTVAAALETMADKASGGRLGRTKSVLVGRSLLNAAKADFANVRKSALGEGKFSIDSPTANDFVQGIKDRQRVFKFAPAEGYRKATNWAMNNQYFGDEAFVRAAYARALGGYLKANGITAEQFGSEAWREKHTDIVDKARSYAVKEAQETTFRDHNALSDWVSRIGRRPDTPKPVQALSAGMMPFRRTPANVLARAEEYSPLGLLNTAYMGAKKALSATSATQSRGLIGEAARSGGEVSGTDIINSLSKALTGTGLFALGMYLKSLGMIRGGADDDEKQAAFDDLTGHQNYALELPNGLSVTIDWLSPTAMPLFMGAQLEQLREDGGIDLKDIESALTSLADPMIEMSMMQGINDAVDDLKFSDNNLIQLAISSSLSYLTQGLTNTLVGQIRRAYSGENTMTYVDKNSPVPDWLQRELGSASKKSVFPAFQQIPYLDAWGREEETGDVLERSINSLFNPAYVSQVDVDKVERELQRVKDATGDGGVFPQRAGRSIEFDGETHDLTAEQYQKYARAKGRSSYSLVSDAINSGAYRAMGSGDRAEFVKKMYGYADYQAKRSVFPRYENSAYAKYAQAETVGMTPVEYYVMTQTYDYDHSSQTGQPTQEEAQRYLDTETALGRSQKADMWTIINKSWKQNPYT